MEKCANCERAIGNLETPHVHEGHVVCEQCAVSLGSRPASGDIAKAPPADARHQQASMKSAGKVLITIAVVCGALMFATSAMEAENNYRISIAGGSPRAKDNAGKIVGGIVLGGALIAGIALRVASGSGNNPPPQ